MRGPRWLCRSRRASNRNRLAIVTTPKIQAQREHTRSELLPAFPETGEIDLGINAP
jgi:hypothetical protein